MFAVIFEVLPKGERREDYLHHAGLLRPELESIDGFLTNDRYASLGRRGWVLSLSLWRNEKAVIRWRTQARHHAAQQMGRAEIFADYHLRVGEITSDTALRSGDVLPQTRFDETEAVPPDWRSSASRSWRISGTRRRWPRLRPALGWHSPSSFRGLSASPRSGTWCGSAISCC